MNLLSVLLTLLVLYVWQPRLPSLNKLAEMYDRYLTNLQNINQLKDLGLLLLAVILPLLGVAIILGLLLEQTGHFLTLLLNLAILLYCIDISVWRQPMELVATPVLVQGHDSLVIDSPAHRLFWQIYQQLFGVLFWFTLFGGVGALLYRLLEWLSRPIQGPLAKYPMLLSAVQALLAVVDWLPVRCISFLYTLVGHFTAVFNYWLGHVINPIKENYDLLTSCGFTAVAEDQVRFLDDPVAAKKAILKLNQRALIVWLIIMLLVG